MHKSIGSILVAIAVLLPAGTGRAADGAICDAYVKEAVGKAQGVRQFECGYALDDPRWAAARDGHARWCKSADKAAVTLETARRRGEMKLCQTCRAYADIAIATAADNAKLKCGLEGPRWDTSAAAHFSWCMAQGERGPTDNADVAAQYKIALEKMQQPLNVETQIRLIEKIECVSRQPKPAQALRRGSRS